MKKLLLVSLSLSLFNLSLFSQNNNLQFNGGTGQYNGPYVNVSNNSNDFNLGTVFTIEAWINVSPNNIASAAILSKGGANGSYDNSYALEILGGTLQFYNVYSVTPAGWINSGYVIPTNVWTHVSVTYNGSTLIFYVNGVNVASFNEGLSLTPGAGDFYIGNQGGSCFCNRFYGQMDELRVWSVALSAYDIAANLYNTATGTETGLVASYSFNQGVAGGNNTNVTTLTDVKGTHNGTLNGFPLTGSLGNWLGGGTTILGNYFFGPQTITGFSPLSGPVGSSVVITGNGFSPIPTDNKVTFGGMAATVLAASDNSLTVIVPAGASYNNIQVEIGGLIASSSKPFNVIYNSCSSNTFAPQVNVAVGTGPIGVAVGDFNGDAIPDLVTGNSGTNTISVLLGTGGGNFATQVTYPSGGSAPYASYFVTVGDFNGDGFQDIASANNDNSAISILTGTGTGAFGSPVSFSVLGTPYSVTTGDFNGDGIQDLVSGSNNISVLLGLGGGNFAPEVTYATGTTPIYVAVGDFNGDGIQDLAIANDGSNNISILLGTGTGTFGSQTTYPAGNGPFNIVVADFNGDNKQDLAVSNQTSNNISVLLGTGTGAFGSQTTYATGTSPFGLVVGDFNGDGKQDLASTNLSSNNISILTGSGLGTFGASVNYSAGTNPWILSVADLNQDGKQDLVAANKGSNNISILFGECVSITGISPSATVCSGVATSISVTATGSNLNYQWYQNGVELIGATTSGLTINNVTSTSVGIYTVIIQGFSGSITSSGISFGVGCNNTLNFDGNSDYVDIGTGLNSIFPGGTALSAEAWVYPTTYRSEYATIVSNYNSSYTLIFRLSSTGNVMTFFGGGNLQSVSALPLNQWTHVASTWDGKTMQIYINGVLDVSAPYVGTLPGNGNLWTIGKNTDGTQERFIGNIDEVRVWNVPLSQLDIQRNMFRSVNTTTLGLLANYNFNQGVPSGNNSVITSLSDISGYNRTGTLVSFGLSGPTSNWVSATNTTISGVYLYSAPTITGITPNQTICAGGNFLVSVFATGSYMTYQWYKNGSIISGANTSTITLTGVTATTSGNYTVVLNNPGGTVTSSGISLVVGCNNALNFDGGSDIVLISQTPSLVSLGPVGFTLSAWVYPTNSSGVYSIIRKTGDYDLYINNGVIGAEVWPAGAGTGSFIIQTGTTTIPVNQWTNLAAVWNGTSFVLYVNGVLDPSNTSSSSAGTNDNLTLGQSITWGQPFLGNLDEIYIWNIPLSQSDIQSNFNKEPNGTVSGLVAYYNFNEGVPNGVNTNITNLVDNSWNSNDGTLSNFNLSGAASNWVSSSVVNAGVLGLAAPTITGISQTQTVCGGATTFLSVTITGGSGASYQWYQNGTSISGANTATLTLTGVTSTNSGLYAVGVTSPGGNVTSSEISLTVGCNTKNAIFFTGSQATQPIPVPALATVGPAFTFEFWTNPTSLVSYQKYTPICFNNIGGNTDKFFVQIEYNSPANMNLIAAYYNGAQSIYLIGIIPTNTWSHIAVTTDPVSGDMRAFMNGSLIASQTITDAADYSAGAQIKMGEQVPGGENYEGGLDEIRVWQGTRSNAQILSNFATTLPSTTPGLLINATFDNEPSPTLFTNQVTGSTYNLNGAFYIPNYTFTGIPTSVSAITSSSSVCTGSNVLLNVTAAGTALTYQWYQNSNPIPGQTFSTLSLVGVNTTSAGNYFVVVNGYNGTVTSSGLTLNILSSPGFLTQPVSSTICEGNTNVFSISAIGSGLTYLWSNGATTPTITVSGIGNYTATVSGTCGTAISNSVSLSTISGTTILLQPTSATICGGNKNVFSVSAAGSGLIYNWSNGPTTQNITVSGIGNYTVTVSGTCGTAVSNTVSLSTLSGTTITNQPTNATICGGNTNVFSVSGAGPGLTYLWNNGASTPTITVSGNGNYTATVSGTCGTIVSNTANLSVQTITVGIFASSTSITIGQPVTLSGVGALTYTFTGGILNGVGFTPSATNTYTVTGSSALGCTNSASVTIVVSALPTQMLGVSPSSTVCGGITVNYSVTAVGTNLTYQWYNSGQPISGQTSSILGLASVTQTNSGIYTCVVMGDGGTITSSGISLWVSDPTVGVNAPLNPICAGTTISLSGTGALNYTISGGVTNNVPFVPSTSGTFTITGTDIFECSNQVITTITVLSLPVISAQAIPSQVCFGNNVTLLGTGATLYSWSNGLTNGAGFVPTISGIYTLTGTGANSCSTTTSVNVAVNQLPNVGISASSNGICTGSSVTLSGTGALSYSWSNGVSDGIGFVPSQTGTYSVNGLDINGCSNSASTVIAVVSNPTVVGFVSSNSICLGQTVTFTGSGAQTYSWTGGVVDGVSYSPLITNIYTVTGYLPGGCFSTNTVQVSINPLPTVSGFATYPILCYGNATTLIGLGALIYTWSGGVQNSIGFVPTVSGIYTVTGFDINSCSQTSTVPITVNPLPSVGINSSSNIICIGKSVTLKGTGALTYNWSNGISNNVPFAPTITQTYTVTGLDGNGCANSDTATIYVSPNVVLSGLTTTSIGFGQPLNESLQAKGIGPFTFGVIMGSMPSGISLSSSSGTFIGEASSVGSYSFGISANNAYCQNTSTIAGTIKVVPGDLIITAENYFMVEGSPVPASFPYTIANLAPWDTSNIVVQVTPENFATSTVLGKYVLAPKVSGSSLSNYSLTVNQGVLYVKYGLTVTGKNYSRNYGEGGNPLYTGSVTGLQPNGTSVNVNFSSTVIGSSPVGVYPIDINVSGKDTGSYVVTLQPGSYTILPAPLTVAANNFVKLQGDPIPTFASTIYGLVNGESLFISYFTTANQSSPAGQYPVYPNPSGVTLSNYSLTTVSGILTIGTVPSPLNVSIGNYSRYYGYSDPTYIGTVTGIKQGDDVQVSFHSNSSSASPIGTYPIIINLTGTDISKYTITTTAGLLTINPAPLTVTANSYSISYGDFIPSLSGVINGLENGDTINVSYQTTASASSNAGSYPIVPQVTASNILNNYNLVVRNGNLNVSKVNLTVIGANLNRAYGEVNPELSYNILGFVNNENITVIDTVPYGQTFAQSNSSVGTYPITYVGGKDNNYSFTYVNGSLLVTQANQTILIASQVANVYSGNTLGITALVSSGLALTATSSDTSVIKVVNGLEISGVSNGITTITITQNGNDNYQAAPPVTITGISTSTGIVSPSIIGVIGSGTVVKNEPVTYSMPLKSGYTYLWVFTGQNLNWLNSDSTSNSIKVLFTPETTKGQMIGRMYDPQGNLVKSDSIPIVFDNDPNALVAAYLAQQLQPVQCPVVVTDCDSAYIQIYSFGSQLKNVTGCSNNGFGDYSAINKVDTLVMGTSYSLEVVCVNKKSSASYFGIWIDYSNDGSFADPDDFVRSSFNTDTVFQVNNIVIRNNTNYIGPRRMRVSMQTSGEFVQSQFCPAQGTVGETEDYLVYIKQEDALNAPGLITPNDDGKNDYFIINGINPKLDNKLLISDRWGRKVFEQTNYQNTWGGTDNNGKLLEDGTYFYFFTNGSVEIRGYVEIKANK